MTSYKRIFEGIRIIDVTQYIAGPVAARLLVDLGAEVIKIEPPPHGEGNRIHRFNENDRMGPGMYFALHNRGKKAVCIDFKRPEGAAIIRDLAKKSDVLLENYTPGVLKRYGLGYADISVLNPNIVMCSVSTYGQEGPYARRIGNDAVALAAGALLHMIGEPDGHPVYPASAIGDHMTAVNAFGAISAALFHRQRTGEGQYIDLALVDCVYNSHDWQLAMFNASDGEVDPQRGGTQRTGSFPYGVFKAKDSFISIGLLNDAQWKALATRIGSEQLFAVPEFETNAGRIQYRDALKQIIEEWLATLSSDDEAIQILADELRMPAARLLSVGEFARDPILSPRMVEKMPMQDGREMLLLKSPHKFSKTPPEIPGPPPALGEHTCEILRSICGYSEETIRSLMDRGLIHETHPS